jgi:hypothetical protein
VARRQFRRHRGERQSVTESIANCDGVSVANSNAVPHDSSAPKHAKAVKDKKGLGQGKGNLQVGTGEDIKLTCRNLTLSFDPVASAPDTDFASANLPYYSATSI